MLTLTSVLVMRISCKLRFLLKEKYCCPGQFFSVVNTSTLRPKAHKFNSGPNRRQPIAVSPPLLTPPSILSKRSMDKLSLGKDLKKKKILLSCVCYLPQVWVLCFKATCEYKLFVLLFYSDLLDFSSAFVWWN